MLHYVKYYFYNHHHQLDNQEALISVTVILQSYQTNKHTNLNIIYLTKVFNTYILR